MSRDRKSCVVFKPSLAVVAAVALASVVVVVVVVVVAVVVVVVTVVGSLHSCVAESRYVP